MSRLKKIGIGLLILALAVGAFFAVQTGFAEQTWASLSFNQKNEFVPPPPPEVTVALPVERYVADSIELTGTTRATARVDLRAQVTGYLQEIQFIDGQMVNAEEELFLIEQAPFQAELDAATARLEKAKASLQLADANLARVAALYRRNAATKQESDVQVAERAGAAAEVLVAQAAVDQAQLEFDYTKIDAPITGRISRHLVDVGNLVRAEETLLASIESIDKIHAYFYLSERDLLRFMEMLREKQIPDPDTEKIEIRMGLANDSDYPYLGYLDYRETSVDPGTGTIERRAIFENEDRTLIPGLFVRLRADVGDPQQRFLVEERAIGSDQKGDFLLIVNPDDHKVERRDVKLGISMDGLRVVLEGVDGDDWVVVNGLQRARPGAEVTSNDPTKPDEDQNEVPQSLDTPITKAEKEKLQAPKRKGKAG